MYALLQAAEDQVTASGLLLEYAGFLGYFGVFGPLGFRWLVISRTSARQTEFARSDGSLDATLGAAEIGAARIGIFGALFMLLNLVLDIAASAADKGTSFVTAFTGGGASYVVALVFAVLFLVFFAIAMKRVRAAWILAGLTGIAYAFSSITSGKWTSLINPIHEVAASLWIGTLFVLVVAGLSAILRSPLSSDRRGALVADLIGDFSPVAIGASLLLVVTGVTTAWRHLKFLAALWTTSYGYTLDIKLVFVLIVVLLGAWNWRRMRPRLGAEAAAHEIRKSAKFELFFASVVLVITGVLVTLPSPRLPH